MLIVCVYCATVPSRVTGKCNSSAAFVMWEPSNLLGLKQQHEESFFLLQKDTKRKWTWQCCPTASVYQRERRRIMMQACMHVRALCVCFKPTRDHIWHKHWPCWDSWSPRGPNTAPYESQCSVTVKPVRLRAHTWWCVRVDNSEPSTELKDRCRHWSHHDSWSAVRSWHANAYTSAEMRRNRHTTKLQRLTHAGAFIHNLVQRYHKSTCRSIKPLIQSIMSVLLSHTHPNWRTWVPRVRRLKWN